MFVVAFAVVFVVVCDCALFLAMYVIVCLWLCFVIVFCWLCMVYCVCGYVFGCVLRVEVR